jgi:hypothetical protein
MAELYGKVTGTLKGMGGINAHFLREKVLVMQGVGAQIRLVLEWLSADSI